MKPEPRSACESTERSNNHNNRIFLPGYSNIYSGGSRISETRSANLLFWPFFPENCMKLKKNGLRPSRCKHNNDFNIYLWTGVRVGINIIRILVFISFSLIKTNGISYLWCVCFYTVWCDKEGNRFRNVAHSLRIQTNKARNFFLQRVGIFKSKRREVDILQKKKVLE